MIGENWAFNSLVSGKLTAGQKTVINAIGPKIGGKWEAVVGTYAYDYDALFEVKWAATQPSPTKRPKWSLRWTPWCSSKG